MIVALFPALRFNKCEAYHTSYIIRTRVGLEPNSRPCLFWPGLVGSIMLLKQTIGCTCGIISCVVSPQMHLEVKKAQHVLCRYAAKTLTISPYPIS